MKKLFLPMVILALLGLLSGCAIPAAIPAGPSSGTPGSPDRAAAPLQIGSVELRVTDAPRKDNVTAIWVTVTQVQIHKAGTDNRSEGNDADWITANLTGANRFELLALRKPDGVQIQQFLGSATLAAGKYTQVRLVVEDVTVTLNGENKTAEVPSGKVKLVHPFDVIAGQATVLLFDFDAAKMVTVAGKSGKILVKPVIKLTSGKSNEPNEPNHPTKPTTTPVNHSLKITTAYLPNGDNGTSYSANLTVEGGASPYKWTIDAGLLPQRLSLDAITGIVAGTPTTEGNFNFTVKVTDNSTPNKSGTKEFSVSIAPPGTLMVTNKSLPDAVLGTSYNVTLQAIGGVLPYTAWIVIPNQTALPAGLSLNSVTGAISGTPTAIGNSNFIVQVTDNVSHTDSQALSIKVKQN